MTVMKTSILAAAFAIGTAVSAGAVTLQSADGPQEYGAAPQAWMNNARAFDNARGAYASAESREWQVYRSAQTDEYSPRVDIQ